MLPLVAAGFAAGEIGREHVDACTKTLARLPLELREDATVTTGVDEYLVEQCYTFDARAVERLGRHLVEVLAPDDDEGFDPERFLRRAFTLPESPDGMTLGRLQLDQAGAAYLKAVLNHFGKPGRGLPDQLDQADRPTRPTGRPGRSGRSGRSGRPARGEAAEGELHLSGRDGRSQAQRWADALVEICRLAMSVDPATVRREPAHVLVITTPEQLADAHTRAKTPPASSPRQQPQWAQPAEPEQAEPEQAEPEQAESGQAEPGQPEPEQAEPRVPASLHRAGDEVALAAPGLGEVAHSGPIRPATLARLSCDAILQAIVIDPNSQKILNLGRAQRTATRAQRRALAARDGGCICCGAPPERCEAHHITRWSSGGGQTNVDDMVLVCDRDHDLIHHGFWQITKTDQGPALIPPPWHHLARPDGRPVRPSRPAAVRKARKLGQQLRLGLNDDLLPDPDKPPDPG